MIVLALANLVVAVLVLLALPVLRGGAVGGRWILVAPVAFAVAAGALAVYGVLGSPGLDDRPLAERSAAATGDPALDALAARARARLSEHPADAGAWRLLADARARARRYGDAALAMTEAAVLDPGNAGLAARQGEFIVLSHDGVVTPSARQAFARALALDPDEPVARFYGGIALAQAGDVAAALALWRDLLDDTPAGAPWLAELNRRIAEAEIMGSVATMTAGEQLDLVTGMVESLALRLEEEPDDLEGWIRLARSHAALGNSANARAAWERALGLAPEDGDLWDDFAASVASTVHPGKAVPPGAAEDMKRVLEVRPDNLHALAVAGLAAAGAGDSAQARRYWTRLGELLDPAGAEYREVRALLESLGD